MRKTTATQQPGPKKMKNQDEYNCNTTTPGPQKEEEDASSDNKMDKKKKKMNGVADQTCKMK